MPPYELKERTRLFALAVVEFCRHLPQTDEAREAARRDWLVYLADAQISSAPDLLEEARALTRILGAALRTTRANIARMKEVRKRST